MQAKYVGTIKWTPLSDGRLMELLDDYGFIDSSESTWRVPKGARVDGASIPQALWSFVGSPFTGRYRDASVIHDFCCDVRKRPWQKVHRVFYEAMIVSGVSASRAKLMYAAVYFAGPRWSETVVYNTNLVSAADAVLGPNKGSRDFAADFARPTPFAIGIQSAMEVHGRPVDNPAGQPSPLSVIALRLPDLERLVVEHDPSPRDIDDAFDRGRLLDGQTRVLLGVATSDAGQ